MIMNKETFEITQENKLGSQSTQIAQQNNYYGMDYQNTKALCHDLIKSELAIYKEEAEKTAKERDEKFLSTFFEQLHNAKIDDNVMCEEFKNPDMQYTYIEAQKAYIRLGTPELENILSNLLVERAKETQRSLLQIALSEAVTVVPMLLPVQLDILALCFTLKYSRKLNVNNIPSFLHYIQNDILPHISSNMDKQSLFQHLVYTKTASIDLGELSLEDIFLETYGGLFLRGYSIEELDEYPSKYPKLFTKCIHDNKKLQINAISEEALDKVLKTMKSISPSERDYIQKHFSNNLMNEKNVRQFICSHLPNTEELFKQWNDTILKHLSLTSVGIVLGAKRSTQLTGNTYNMNIWI